MLKMAAILKSKMAAKREMTSNFLSTFIVIHEITNIGIAIILTSFLGQNMLKMAAILKSNMAATGTDEKNGNNLI